MLREQRLLMVCNTSWGIVNFRMGIIKAFQDKGFKVFVIAPYDDSSSILIENGVVFKSVKIDNKGTSPFKDIQLGFQFFRYYKLIKPQLIFHYTIKPNIYGSIAAALARIRSIAFVTGAGYVFSRRSILTSIVEGMFKIAFSFSLEVWFLNKEDVSLFLERKLVSEEKVKLLPGEGINTRLFKPSGNPDDQRQVTFLFFSRLLWDKGVGIFVEAARLIKEKFPAVKFQILGFLDCENPEAVKREDVQAWEEEGVIEYLGSTKDVRNFILDATCIVLPSFYREGIPRTLLEAASLEKPIITTDNVGCRDVVDDNVTGFLCKVKDVKHLAEKMDLLITMTKEERSTMGKKARRKILDQFDEKFVIEFYIDVLNKYLI